MAANRKRVATHHLYLIPGFFGFANLGGLRYFVHIRDFFLQRYAARGETADVHVVKTHPTASLARRSARLAETIERTLPANGQACLIGHSTGGLDARLLLAPGVRLPTAVDVEGVAKRVRAAVTVSTPHYGAPLAAVLSGLRGQQLLELVSVSTIYILRFGHLPLRVAVQLAWMLSSTDDRARRSTLGDALFQQLLRNFSTRRRYAVERLLSAVAKDQTLLLQLTPEGMDLFATTVRQRPEVRCGSVVTRANPPGMASTLATGFDPAAQAAHLVYHALHRLAAPAGDVALPKLTTTQATALRRAFRRLPQRTDNDGIVPTLSQPWGEVIAGARADHLDIIGHFAEPDADPPHFDWLTTGSGFNRSQFEAVWNAVADFLER